MLPTWKIKTVAGLIVNIALVFILSGATVGYFVWRQDKPPDNPGGPVGGMGIQYVFWSWIGIGPGPALNVWALFNIGHFAWDKFKSKHEKARASE